MDYNEYTITSLVRQRHAEMIAAAARNALARRHRRPPPDVRAALGAALIRLGAWLLREHYVTP
jgi:hypothetical protein